MRDIYCRLANFPKCVNLESDRIEKESLLNFRRSPQSGNWKESKYELSIISKSIGESKVHEYGNSVAEIQSDRIKLDFISKGKEYTENDKVIYLGFFEIFNTIIESIELRYCHIEIINRPENNCNAHYQIEIWLKDEAKTESSDIVKKDFTREMQEARIRIFQSLQNPVITTFGPATLKPELFEYLTIR